MRFLVICLVMAGVLAGCGADGEPVQPTANVDVTVGNSGVHTSTRIGASGGWWNVSLGKVF